MTSISGNASPDISEDYTSPSHSHIILFVVILWSANTVRSFSSLDISNQRALKIKADFQIIRPQVYNYTLCANELLSISTAPVLKDMQLKIQKGTFSKKHEILSSISATNLSSFHKNINWRDSTSSHLLLYWKIYFNYSLPSG